MQDSNQLFRSLDAEEAEALGPMPVGEDVSPTTDRDDRSPAFTAEVHYAGTVESSSPPAAADDPFAPPRSLTEDE